VKKASQRAGKRSSSGVIKLETPEGERERRGGRVLNCSPFLRRGGSNRGRAKGGGREWKRKRHSLNTCRERQGKKDQGVYTAKLVES